MDGFNTMIERIMSREGVFYKVQQRGDPDLTEDDKRSILLNLYNSNPRLFISRYFTYLVPEDCSLFDEEDYDIGPYIKRIYKNSEHSNTEKVRRNVRFAELERLKKETDYFSYPKMREREPLLFDKMIGRYLSEEEQIYLRPTVENESLSGLLMQFEESEIVSNRRKMQLEENVFGLESNKDAQFSKLKKLALHAECREASEEEIQQELEGELRHLSIKPENSCNCEESSRGIKGNVSNEKNGVSDKEEDDDEEMVDDQEELKNDFIDYMEQKFLLEKDAEFFDYGALYNQRNSKELDRICDQDYEDAYFADDQ